MRQRRHELFSSTASNHTRQFALPHEGLIVPLIAIALLAASGCGPKSDRLPIRGQVTFDGAPLDDGTIRFSSLPGEPVAATGAMIEQGAYDIQQEKGLRPGTYRVEISAPDTSAPPVAYRAGPGQPASPPTAPERIPPEYNFNSKQQVEVSIDGNNEFNFDIVSRGAK